MIIVKIRVDIHKVIITIESRIDHSKKERWTMTEQIFVDSDKQIFPSFKEEISQLINLISFLALKTSVGVLCPVLNVPINK